MNTTVSPMALYSLMAGHLTRFTAHIVSRLSECRVSYTPEHLTPFLPAIYHILLDLCLPGLSTSTNIQPAMLCLVPLHHSNNSLVLYQDQWCCLSQLGLSECSSCCVSSCFCCCNELTMLAGDVAYLLSHQCHKHSLGTECRGCCKAHSLPLSLTNQSVFTDTVSKHTSRQAARRTPHPCVQVEIASFLMIIM